MQAPQARQQNNYGRPRFGNYVENFLQYLDEQGVNDQDKINYLGEILSALSYFKFNDPNFLEYCAGQKIVQDGYRDAQRQKYHNNGDEENISDRTNSNGFRDHSHENQSEINYYDNQPSEDINDAKTNDRKTQDQYHHKPTHRDETHGIDGYHSSHIENHDEDHENENAYYDYPHGDDDDYSNSDDNSSEDDDKSSDSDDDHLDYDDDQEYTEDHDNDTQEYSEGSEKERIDEQSIDGRNLGDRVHQRGNKNDPHVTSQEDAIVTSNRDRDNRHLNEFSTPQGSLNDDYYRYSDGSRDRDTYGRHSQNYDHPNGPQSQENKSESTKSDYSERSSNYSSRDSYDPYSGRVGQRPIDEIEYSGDYDNTYSPAQDTSGQVNDYLNRIRLHNLPPHLAQYAQSYLNYAKNAVKSYSSYAKNFNDIQPCLESLVQYFNLLNDDLANAYKRCQDDCFYSRLDSYSTSVTQYTATTNECIAKGIY